MAFNFSSDGIQWQGSGGGSGGEVTPDSPTTFSNKTISADDNTILNLRKSNFADGTVRDSVRPVDEASDQKLVTEKAVAEATATYIFEQAVASDTWVVTHNLNKFPSVFVQDSAGTQFLAPVFYNSANQLTISMNGATTGKAYLN
jgi:hypothetical protein